MNVKISFKQVISPDYKIYITGGDNCYCGACGGVCDRLVMLVDKGTKTLRYLPIVGGETCLGKYCTHDIQLKDEWSDWVITRVTFGGNKWQAINRVTGDIIPVVVKNQKWGKDGEYGSFGSSFFGERVGDEVILRDLRKGVSFDEWLNDDSDFKTKQDKYTKETGWKLILK